MEKYEMIPRAWLIKWMEDHKFMAGCRKRSETAEQILEDWDEYQWYHLPLYVRRDIEREISETWDQLISKLYKIGLMEEAVKNERAARKQQYDLMREWILGNEED